MVLFLRAVLALLILPGVFAGLIPAWIVTADHSRTGTYGIGWLPVVVGIAILVWSVRDFYVAGKGTLAPWDPPKHLVVVGLYRFVRNPMYVGILIFLAGWVMLTGSRWLAAYTGVLAIAFHLRVVLYEEPRLRRQFADEKRGYWHS